MSISAIPVSGESASETNLITNMELLANLSQTIGTLTRGQYVWHYSKATSSIGKHIRHIIDHYTCFFKNLTQAFVDYDDRPRLTTIETRPHQACVAISNVIVQLSRLDASQAEAVHVYISAVPNKDPVATKSSLQRELLFLQSHTIHHMAVIQLMLDKLGISVDSDFALAPSTISYNQSVGYNHE